MIACDLETCLFRPGLQAPPPVCLSTFDGVNGALYPTDEIERQIANALQGETLWHNSAFDLTVLLEWFPALRGTIFAALESGLVHDSLIFQRLAEIAGAPRGPLGLSALWRVYGFGELAKGSVRTSYGPLWNRPLEEYSAEQRAYALLDAEATWKLYERQRAKHRIAQADVAILVRKQFWLQLTRNRGLRTDPSRLEILAAETHADLEDLRQFFQAEPEGAPFVRANGTRNMKAIAAYVQEAYSGSPPKTDAGRVSTSRATLEESGDPILERFAEYGETSAVENKDLPMLLAGCQWPIHTRYGIADTTRSTSSAPNVQNLRRKAGIREGFIPREGFCFVAIDHGGLENATLAQVCVTNLGLRGMAAKINAGEDLHCHVAAKILGTTYEIAKAGYKEGDEKITNARNCAKVVNFGRPGGMGAPTLKLYAKQSYGLDLTLSFCQGLIQAWNAANPDGMAYLKWIGTLTPNGDRYELTIPGTTILRRNATFCAAANSHFQGLGAIVEAECGWRIAEATFGIGEHAAALRGCRLVNFVHDEFILEVPVGDQTRAAAALETIMTVAPRKYMPDVTLKAECIAMSRWSKKAKRIVVDGELQIDPCE